MAEVGEVGADGLMKGNGKPGEAWAMHLCINELSRHGVRERKYSAVVFYFQSKMCTHNLSSQYIVSSCHSGIDKYITIWYECATTFPPPSPPTLSAPSGCSAETALLSRPYY